MSSVAPTALVTVLDFLRYAVSAFERVPVFYGHGTDNAWDEACELVLQSLHLPLDVNPALIAAHLLPDEKALLWERIQKRTVDRIPTAYLVGQAWLSGVPFYVDPRVLIPRSPLARLIEQHFSPWLPEEAPVSRILDIGTGSGCLACLCALAFPDAQVDALDISPEALCVAEKNRARHHLEDRLTLLQSDVFSAVPSQKYDIIISNPPYVDAQEMAHLPPEYYHEPRLGLASGVDGLECVRTILKEAKHHLSKNGLLFVEVGHNAHALSAAFPQLPFTWLDLPQGAEGVFLLNAHDLP